VRQAGPVMRACLQRAACPSTGTAAWGCVVHNSSPPSSMCLQAGRQDAALPRHQGAAQVRDQLPAGAVGLSPRARLLPGGQGGW
jgi:hypothetical protein